MLNGVNVALRKFEIVNFISFVINELFINNRISSMPHKNQYTHLSINILTCHSTKFEIVWKTPKVPTCQNNIFFLCELVLRDFVCVWQSEHLYCIVQEIYWLNKLCLFKLKLYTILWFNKVTIICDRSKIKCEISK